MKYHSVSRCVEEVLMGWYASGGEVAQQILAILTSLSQPGSQATQDLFQL